MNTKSQPYKKSVSSNLRSQTRRSYPPGGWQDRLAFGYMFRVLTGLAATVLPMILLTVIGFFNGWKITEPMLFAFGAIAGLTAFLGEAVRIGVYETRKRNHTRKKGAREFNTDAVDQDFLTRAANPDWEYLLGKRVFDILLSTLIVTLLIPGFTVIMLAIKFDSAGPVIFRQARVGYKGRTFNLFKFRTMYINGESKNGSRITPVGHFLRRTSIDELPQLINVLSGAMSLVGPRPPKASPNDPPLLNQRALIYFAKPGITGVAAMGNQEIAYTYLVERSFLLDLKIMFRTLVMLTLKNMY